MPTEEELENFWIQSIVYAQETYFETDSLCRYLLWRLGEIPHGPTQKILSTITRELEGIALESQAFRPDLHDMVDEEAVAQYSDLLRNAKRKNT